MSIQEVNEALPEHLKIAKVGSFYQLIDVRMQAAGIPQIWIFKSPTQRNQVIAMAKIGCVPVPSPRCTPDQLQAAQPLFSDSAWAKVQAWLEKAEQRRAWIANGNTAMVKALDYAQRFV